MVLVGLLIEQHDFHRAIEQYEQLDRRDPGNPDILQAWGRLLLRDPQRSEVNRKQAAADVWLRLLPAAGRRPDSGVIEQVADLFRQAGITEQALELYRRAVANEPDDPGPRTHLGEYLHSLGRRAEALDVWRGIAAGSSRDSRRLRILADVLADHDYRDEAIAILTDARSLEPNDLGLLLQLADLLARSSQHTRALEVLNAAERLAKGPDQAEQVLSRRLENELATGMLLTKADALAKALAEGRESGVEPWYRLARYCEAMRQWTAADGRSWASTRHRTVTTTQPS